MSWTSLVAQMVKRLPTMQDTQVQSLGQEVLLEKEMATHLVFLPGKSHGWRSLVGYSPWGHKESDTTEWLHFSFMSCTGEGIGQDDLEDPSTSCPCFSNYLFLELTCSRCASSLHSLVISESQRCLWNSCQKPTNQGWERKQAECHPGDHLASTAQLVKTILAKPLRFHPEQIIKSSVQYF